MLIKLSEVHLSCLKSSEPCNHAPSVPFVINPKRSNKKIISIFKSVCWLNNKYYTIRLAYFTEKVPTGIAVAEEILRKKTPYSPFSIDCAGTESRYDC